MSEEVSAAEKELDAVQDNFNQCVKRYVQAGMQLEDAARELQKLGVWPAAPTGARLKLCDEREARTHKFKLGIEDDEIKVYITPGIYSDGRLGEIFLRADRQGSLVRGLMASFATLVSIALQYGGPLDTLVSKVRHVRFEPARYTGKPPVRKASSMIDYIAQWLALNYLEQPTVEDTDE